MLRKQLGRQVLHTSSFSIFKPSENHRKLYHLLTLNMLETAKGKGRQGVTNLFRNAFLFKTGSSFSYIICVKG